MKFIDRKGNQVDKPPHKDVKKRVSVYGIAHKENRILMIKPAWIDRWELPGGGFESYEKPKEALEREFFEETGFRIISDEKLIHSAKTNFYADDVDEYFENESRFYAVNVVEEGDSYDPGEIQDMQWIDHTTVDSVNIHQVHLEAIRKHDSC